VTRRAIPLIVLLLVAPELRVGAAIHTPAVTALLDLYDHGDHAAVGGALAGIRNVDVFRRRLEQDAPAWILARGPESEDRRRLVAASLALEAARATVAEWDASRHLVEWGCQLLRAGGPPQPAEYVWHLAAAALIQSAGDTVFLVGLPPMARDRHPARGKAIDHLAHAEARFPSEDRFKLVRAVAYERMSWRGEDRNPVWVDPARSATILAAQESARREAAQPPQELRFERSAALQLVKDGRPPQDAATRSLELWQLVDLLTPLAERPSVQAEARVRLGVTCLRLGRRDRALAELRRAAPPAADPFLVYLTRYFTGRALEADGDRPAAAAEYRAALQAVPQAQSATLALSAILFVAGSREEAFALTRDATQARPPADPWREYVIGENRFLPALIGRLREGLR